MGGGPPAPQQKLAYECEELREADTVFGRAAGDFDHPGADQPFAGAGDASVLVSGVVSACRPRGAGFLRYLWLFDYDDIAVRTVAQAVLFSSGPADSAGVRGVSNRCDTARGSEGRLALHLHVDRQL